MAISRSVYSSMTGKYLYSLVMGAMYSALFIVPCAQARTINGFDLDNTLVPTEAIHHGGPPRDGIPALTDPNFVTVDEADIWLQPTERILGVAHQGQAKAYPLAIMNWHEIVNDTIGSQSIVVTYCPLCYSGMAFKAKINNERFLFGVSGLLYNSDVLLYDRQTESLWSQIKGEAVAGPMAGRKLQDVPIVNTTWRDWHSRHPQTQVLSRETGHSRDYDRDPYASYRRDKMLYFPVEFRSKGYHPKEPVIGLMIDGQAKAYPTSELARTNGIIIDEVNGDTVLIHFDTHNQSGTVYNTDCEPITSVMLYWFAWYAFHPETEVYHADEAGMEVEDEREGYCGEAR